MTRRILTHREQAQMLAPWREAALEFQRGDIHPDYGPDPDHAISAHLDGEPVGRMLWYPDGELTQIEVDPEHKHKGIGTQMFNWAKENVDPRLHHSPVMTDAGRGWAASMGYEPDEYERVSEPEGSLWKHAMSTYYHHTDDPDFALSPAFHPEDWSGGNRGPGVFVSRDPERWKAPYGDSERAHMVSFDAPDDLPSIPGSPDESFVPAHMYHLLNQQDKEDDWEDPFGARIAMPMPTPEGVRYHYFPTNEHIPESWDAVRPILAPAVGASHNGKPIGALEWHPPDPDADDPSRYGEIAMIDVHPKYQRMGIGSGMFDHARKFVPELHHSENLTDLGRSWSQYEKNRQQVHARIAALLHDAMGARGPLPPLDFEPFDSPWFNGVMARHQDDGRPVGYLTWHPDGEIDMIHTHPDLQRRGIGTAMGEHVLANPHIYESKQPLHQSDYMSPAGHALAQSRPEYDPSQPFTSFNGENESEWGWKPPDFVPLQHPYRGQNEDELKPRLTPGFHS